MPHFVEKNQKDHADFSNVTYLCSDVMKLDFEKSSFDFVFLHEDIDSGLLALRAGASDCASPPVGRPITLATLGWLTLTG